MYKSWFLDFKLNNTIPKDYKKGKLKDILKLNKDSIKVNKKPNLPYLPIDVIPMNTFALSEFKSNEEAKSSLISFSKDDIIIGAMRVYFHRVIIAPCDGITRTTCFTLTPKNKEYLSFALLTCNQNSSIDYAQTTSKGSTMPYAVWDGGLGDMEILIPPINTAKEFNDLIIPMIKQIQHSFFENKSLKKLREYLMENLLSGKIDISKLNI